MHKFGLSFLILSSLVLVTFFGYYFGSLNRNVLRLPIDVSLLRNPIVSQLHGWVEGTLKSKDNGRIIISDEKGNSISIPYGPLAKSFSNKKTSGKYTPITVSEIPIGAKVRADFFNIPTDRDKNNIGESSVIYLEEPEK